MSRSYNIPASFMVEKGLPIEFLNQKIKNDKCREIFDSVVKSITWKYQIVNDDVLSIPGALTGKRGISVFEVLLKTEADPELLTEIIAGFIPRRMVLIFISEDMMAISSYVPDEHGLEPRLQNTCFYEYSVNAQIDIYNIREDLHKDYKVIQRRILGELKEKKKEMLIDKTFAQVSKTKKNRLDDFDILFSQANLDKIREDAEFVEEQLKVLF